MNIQKYSLLLTGLLIGLLYLFFLCPTIYNGDSPLLSASAFGMGLGHPPGYPLYVQLGKIFTFIPFGSIPYRLNLFSALCGVLASLLVFKSVYLLTRDNAASVFSALLSAFLPLTWLESLKAEVYTLNCLLVMVVFYTGLKFLKDGFDRRLLMLGAFTTGIGMGNHHTIGFMAFAFAFAFFKKGVDEKRARTFLLCLLFFSLGFSVYLFGYIRSIKYFTDGTLFSYSDMSTYKRFINTFLRKEYGSSIDTIAGPAQNPLGFLRGFYNTVRHFLYGGFGLYMIFQVLAVPFLWRFKAVLGYVLLSFAGYALVLSGMVFTSPEPSETNIFFVTVYMMPVLYITSFLSGIGVSYVLGFFKNRLGHVLRPAQIGLVLLPFVFNLPTNIKDNNLSNYYLVEDFSNNLMHSLPPVSIVISGSDVTYFPVFYKNLIERKRDDIVILLSDKGGILTQANPFWKFKSLFPDLPKGRLFSKVDEAYVKKGRVFTPDILNLYKKLSNQLIAFPYIQCYRLYPKGYRVEEGQNNASYKEAFKMFVYERSLNEKAGDIFSSELKMTYFIPITHYAYLAKKDGNTPLSESFYKTSLSFVTPNGILYYMNYLELVGKEEEMTAFIESLEPYAKQYPEARAVSSALKKAFLKKGG